jgi:hypothetical protein
MNIRYRSVYVTYILTCINYINLSVSTTEVQETDNYSGTSINEPLSIVDTFLILDTFKFPSENIPIYIYIYIYVYNRNYNILAVDTSNSRHGH